LGTVLGMFSTHFIHICAQIISELFLNMLKLISLPMIFFAVIATLTKIKDLHETRTVLRKTFKYTFITTLISAIVGLLFFIIIRPVKGEGITSSFAISMKEHYLSFITKIIPTNPVQPFLENNVLGIAFMATLLGIAIVQLPENQGKILCDFFRAIFDALLKGASILIFIMPIGILSFTIIFVENIKETSGHMQQILFYGICILGANLVQGLVILPIILKWKGHSPKHIAKNVMPALTMAFFSKSSNATLPLTLECAKKRLGVSDKIATFTLPLCSVINMNGCAAFILITMLFVCTSYGMIFTFWEMVLWVFLATVAAIGNAGVPMGCFFLTMAFLMGMGIPLEIMGIILPIYSFFDMVETTLNVWSDICVTTLVNQEIMQKPSVAEP